MKLQTVFSGTHFTDGAKQAKFQPPWPVQIIMFVLVFLLVQIPQSIAVSVAMFVKLFSIESAPDAERIKDLIMQWSMNPTGEILITQLLSTIFPAVLGIIY